MRSIVTNQVAWSVGRSVCHGSEPCKNSWTNQDAIWDAQSCGPKPLRMGRGTFRRVYGPMQSIGFWGLGKRVSCAKMVGPILTICRSYDVFLCKEVPFENHNQAAAHLWGIIHQNLHFWGVNRHFPAKLIKYQHLHIIKTTAQIPTKFCTVIKTTKYS